MPKFGRKSMEHLTECHPDIQRVLLEVVKTFDCSVIEGHRPDAEQDKLYHAGKSKAKAGQSKHNHLPSLAVDVVPYPIDWGDRDRFHYFAGFVMATAQSMDVDLRWGGDWDKDWQTRDNSFDDLPHFELREA